MATDKSEPKLGIIVQIAVLLIVGVVAARFGLMSYFKSMLADEEQKKVAMVGADQFKKQKDEDRARLESVSAEKAAMQLSRGDRGGLLPSQSNDLGPLEGWKQLGRDAGAFVVPPVDAGEPVVTDAGPRDGAVESGPDASRDASPDAAKNAAGADASVDASKRAP